MVTDEGDSPPLGHSPSSVHPQSSPAMPRSPEQRAAANRENSSKSTGPTSEEGKKRSAKNAFKHGMRAVTPMPGEDPRLVAAREQRWNDYYRPGSPAAEHLVKQCVRATAMADHCQN